MSPQVKAALIIAGAIIVGISLWIFFSPFQTCMAGGEGGGVHRGYYFRMRESRQWRLA